MGGDTEVRTPLDLALTTGMIETPESLWRPWSIWAAAVLQFLILLSSFLLVANVGLQFWWLMERTRRVQLSLSDLI